MKNKRKIIVAILTIIIIIAVAAVVYYKFIDSFFNKYLASEKEIAKVGNYILTDRDTEYYKSLFSELEAIYPLTDNNEEEYAVLIAKMFVADFYNLDNKNNYIDIGGTEFVASSAVSNFEMAAKEGMYSGIDQNYDGKRKQSLPVVKEVSFQESEQVSYTFGKSEDENAKLIKLLVEYEVDLGYPESVTVTLIHEDSDLKIVNVK